jgi:hypothetical protein
MATPFLIAAGAGLVAAALFASAATATALAGILFYLAPLPICLAGLGWGSAAGLIAALSGSLVVGLVLGPVAGLAFAAAVGLPLAALCYLALLARAPAGGAPQAALEWYPVGRLAGWAAVISGALAALLILLIGYDAESYRETIKELLQHSTLKDLDKDGTLFTEETIGSLSGILARALPAAFAIVWQCIALFNLWLAGIIVEASGRSLRPWPQLDALELPGFVFLGFVAALVLSFLPGILGLIATGFAGAFLFAYVLQGLAVLHAYSRGMPFRSLLLVTVYLGMLLLGWVAIAVAILGLGEPIFRLRERAAARGTPPNPD